MPDPAEDRSEETTEDLFLGGRLRLRQPRRGHRAGHDAILLASATRVQSGQRVVEFGAGVGAAGLSVSHRVPGIDLTLVEIDAALAALARANAAANGIDAQVIALDVTAGADVFAASGLGPDSADVVLMNPPFHDAGRHRASPDPARRTAHLATDDTLTAWIHAARRVLKSGGSLTLIWRADGLAEVLAALERGFGSVAVVPVHPAPDAVAIRILIRAVKGGRAPLVLHPGFALQDADGNVPQKVQAVLGGTAVLPLADS
ncbi:MAG: methyltransferase [Afipia sp. 62-7]|nr:methyltransferase [Afipia sp.]OJU21553.1 MAG: methyltransferase [Afipia sp. 62-7]